MDNFQLLQPASERSCCVGRMERSSNLQEGLADHPSDSKWQNMPGPSTLSQHHRTSPASYQYNFQSLLGRVHRPLFLSCRAPWCSEQGPQHPVASTLRHASHQAFRKVKSSAWAAAATGVSSTAAAATGVTAAPSCVHLFPGSGPVTSVVVTPLASLASRGLGRRELLIDPV